MSIPAEGPSQVSAPPTRHAAARWVVFASVMLIVVGVINILNGYTLIEHHSYFRTNIPISGGLTGWGWVFVIWGVLQLIAGAVAWSGHILGNIIGVGVCAIGAMIWFLLVFAAPWASLVGIGINVAVIFALTGAGWPNKPVEDWGPKPGP